MNIYKKEARDIVFSIFSTNVPDSLGNKLSLDSITSDDLTDEDIADGGEFHKTTIKIILKYYDALSGSLLYDFNKITVHTAE